MLLTKTHQDYYQTVFTLPLMHFWRMTNGSTTAAVCCILRNANSEFLFFIDSSLNVNFRHNYYVCNLKLTRVVNILYELYLFPPISRNVMSPPNLLEVTHPQHPHLHFISR